MTGICLTCPAAWLVLIRRCQSAWGLSRWHTHTYTHYPRADRGCPAKAGLLLVITIRSSPHSPHDLANTQTRSQTNIHTKQIERTQYWKAFRCRSGGWEVGLLVFCLQFQVQNKFPCFCVDKKIEVSLNIRNNHVCLNHQHSSQFITVTCKTPVKTCITPSPSVLAVLNMQLVYFTSLLARRPILIRVFEKKTIQKKSTNTGQQKVNVFTSLTRWVHSEVNTNGLSAMTDRYVCVSVFVIECAVGLQHCICCVCVCLCPWKQEV